MAEMEHYPNFQKDNYIHPKAAWDKLRMAGARRQNVYLYAATGYGKTELLHRYLRRRRHIWLSGEGLTVETLQEIALPAEATMVIDDLARVLDPAVRREIVSMLDQPGLWLVLAGRCPLPSWLTGPYVNGRLSVIPEEDLRLSEKEIAQLYLSWGVQLPRNLLEKRIIPLVEGNPLGARLLALEMSQGSSYTEELMNDLTRKFYEYLNQAIYSEWPEEIREMMMQLPPAGTFYHPAGGRDDRAERCEPPAGPGCRDGQPVQHQRRRLHPAARRHQQHEAADGDGLRSGAEK